MIRKLLVAIGVSITTAWVGLFGAWAFNPDSGTVAHNELLWRIFGATGEVAGVVTAALVVVLLVALLGRSTAWGIRQLLH